MDGIRAHRFWSKAATLAIIASATYGCANKLKETQSSINPAPAPAPTGKSETVGPTSAGAVGLIGIAPPFGPLAGGTKVHIAGTGFVKKPQVQIGSHPCSVVVVVSPGALTCTTAAGPAGPADVVVSVPGVSPPAVLTHGFTYDALPTLTSLEPQIALGDGRFPLTLHGGGFLSGAAVAVGGVDCPVSSFSSVAVTCKPKPASPGSVSVVLTNADGQSASGPPFRFIGPPVALTLSLGSADIPTWGCAGPVTVSAVDSAGFTVTPAAVVAAVLTVSGGATLYQDADCGGSPAASVSIPPGSSAAVFYVRDPASETLDISASAAGVAAATATLTAAPACISAPSALVSWWDGDSAAPPTFHDLLGLSDGTLLGGASIASGEVGNGINIPPPLGRGEIPDNPAYHFTSQLTVAAWVNSTGSPAGDQTILAKWGFDPVFDEFAAVDETPAAKGFSGAIFDGRYIYYVPYALELNPTPTASGTILRYDPQAGYTSGAFTIFDASTVDAMPTKGYSGAVFDGRYIYFVPTSGFDNLSAHAKVLRFDTTQAFGDIGSYDAFDASLAPVSATQGFSGGVFDGRYVYFVPDTDGVAAHGNVLRYDTTGDFRTASSWSTYAPVTAAGLSGAKGYWGGAFDGRYLYFAPYKAAGSIHGKVLRFDTTLDFADHGSWKVFDVVSTGCGTACRGFHGAIFDGQFVYFVPFGTGSTSGMVLRYDATAGDTDFTSVSAWSWFDAGTLTLPATGFDGGTFDGRYVYFSPYATNEGSTFSGVALRYDTLNNFGSGTAWQSFDASSTGGPLAVGYRGAAFDGRFVYYAPERNDIVTLHGKTLRLDTASAGAVFALKYADGSAQGGNSQGLPRASMVINSATGAAVVSGYAASPGPGWHLVAGVFDGLHLRLNVDGAELATRTLSGPWTLSPAPAGLTIGGAGTGIGGFKGMIDEVQIYKRPLAPYELSDLFHAGTYGVCKN